MKPSPFQNDVVAVIIITVPSLDSYNLLFSIVHSTFRNLYYVHRSDSIGVVVFKEFICRLLNSLLILQCINLALSLNQNNDCLY